MGADIIHKKRKAEAAYQRFISTLDKKQIEMFEEVLDRLFDLNGALTEEDFKSGFRLGLKTGAEGFLDK